ncbi:MAG TPA: FAD-dependent oxidoreductase [Vicinamibacterales bacterium]|nr:FAD-dependent oxidoreductase [Vicinamibacterales bacterium]
MQRDIETLTGRRFDLVVVGGGIHGLFAAYEAASRGWSTALIEAGDIGSGATFNHQRTLHGGLRALQSGNFLKARRQIAERRTWAAIAPHLVRPLPFLIGTYRFTKRSRMLLRAGLKLYDTIGRRRNAGVLPELHLPRTRLESRAATRALFPGIDARGLSGGAVWYDYQTRHPERLTWSVALAAEAAGATLATYVETVGPLRSNGRFTGCRVQDRLTGREVDVEASVTLLSAGAGLSRLHEAFGLSGAPPLLRAVNVLVNRPARDIALAGSPGPGGRMLTAVPWAGHVLVGTHQSPEPVEPGEVHAPAEAVAALVGEANLAFPSLKLTPADVLLVHHGLVPAVVRGRRAALRGEPLVIGHSAHGAPGVVSLAGTKFTTARSAALEALRAVARELGRSRGSSRTDRAVLPHADIADAEGRLIECMRDVGISLDPDIVDHLSSWYGTEAADVVRHAMSAGGLERLTPETPVLTAEVTYAVDRAAAVRLEDVLLRRTPLSAAGHPGRAVTERVAALMGARLGWPAAQQEAELQSFDARLAAGRLSPQVTAR